MKRIQRQRTKGWRMPEGAVYVGRPTRWGNPWSLNDYRQDYPDLEHEQLRQMAVSVYRNWLTGRFDRLHGLPAHPSVDDARNTLRGRDLVCWCPLDQACHADVLLELANR